MPNRIVRWRLANRSLSPVEAEILVFAETQSVTPQTEIRGRIAGPTCPYSTTIEVAYPLRRLPQALPGMPLARRIVIPEPSFWDPTSPFLYRGAIELWEGEDLHEKISVRYGLRSAVLRSDGLRWNGQRLRLLVSPHEDVQPRDVASLREHGYNAAFLDWPDPALVEAAETLGLILLARPASPADETVESAALFAWILPRDWRQAEAEWMRWMQRQRAPIGMYFDAGPVPQGVAFLIDAPDGPWLRLQTDSEGELGCIGRST
jgi:hypothetical protein